jgi:hypothetical protein
MKILTYNDGTVRHGIGVSMSSSDYLTANSGSHVFYRGTNETARIDSSGRLLVGTSASRSTAFGGANFQIESDTPLSGLHARANNAFGAAFVIGKTRGSSNEAVTNGDVLGIVSFQGGNGSTMLNGADITAVVTGAVSGGGANDLPTSLIFSTTADGAGSPTERMRIDSSGKLLVGVTNTYGGASVLYPSSTGIIDLATSVANTPAVLKLGNIGFSNTAEYSTGAVEFRGFDSGGNAIGYASVEGLITDATSATRKGSIVFKTISASTVSEKMRIGSDGLVTLAGPGIKFPATQVASADPNTLDDYEEGTWTPTIAGSTTAGTGTYSNQSGKYTKIGSIVYVEGALVWSAHTGTGGMWLANLPFATPATGAGSGVSFGRIQNITLLANNVLIGYVAASSTVAPLRQYPVGGGAESTVNMDTAGEFNFSITYTIV